MTYRVNNKIARTSQAGVTLLLSVLLLAAITTIAFSLAVVGFAEINTSNDLARTEPILYHSLGIAEEGTYGMKRGVSTIKTNLGSQCDTAFKSYTLGSQPITAQTKYCNINSEYDIEVTVPQNTYSTATRLYVYDPTNNGTGSSGYARITFKKTTNNGGTVLLYMCSLTTECVDPSVSLAGWSPRAGTPIAYNVTETVDIANGSYEIVLLNSGSKEFVEVASYGPGVSDHKGLPYLNKQAIEIQSSFGRLIRRLRVLVPTQ
jgi:hypothetical protein